MPLYAALIIIALIVAGFVICAFELGRRADRLADDEWKRMSRKDMGDRPTIPNTTSKGRE